MCLLPGRIGPANAVEVILANPLANNRMLSAEQAVGLLVQSLCWAGDVLAGRVVVDCSDHAADPAWQPTVAGAPSLLRARTGGLAPAPERALD